MGDAHLHVRIKCSEERECADVEGLALEFSAALNSEAPLGTNALSMCYCWQ